MHKTVTHCNYEKTYLETILEASYTVGTIGYTSYLSLVHAGVVLRVKAALAELMFVDVLHDASKALPVNM
ncbi:hypothetical protein F4781DRAFT_429817 [Annulohypoxylon bovei var. microspora]|nr:hypothetical protein F4781DRAFT_429817 [Annulohypoxylon bovei var. microspora]